MILSTTVFNIKPTFVIILYILSSVPSHQCRNIYQSHNFIVNKINVESMDYLDITPDFHIRLASVQTNDTLITPFTTFPPLLLDERTNQ